MRRSLVVATLAAFLLVPRASHAGVLDPLWAFFASLWSGATEKEGCGMDPDGRCAPALQPKSEEGCGMDPKWTAPSENTALDGCRRWVGPFWLTS